MEISKYTKGDEQFPQRLRDIPSPPQQLFHMGANLSALLARPCVGIVGSRHVSPYGRQVTLQIARQLAEQGIVVISGLALGVDGLAHQAALEGGGLTVAVMPCSLDMIYPATNRHLAERILSNGGALVSEYDQGAAFTFKTNFIARNRLIAGLSQAVLITEAAEKSGSLHTANFALEQGKSVLAVPGSITSAYSVGTNNLIKAGATPVTSYLDVLHELGLNEHVTIARLIKGRDADEQSVLDLLLQGVRDGGALLEGSQLTVPEFNKVMTMLEIGGKIRSLGTNHWALY